MGRQASASVLYFPDGLANEMGYVGHTEIDRGMRKRMHNHPSLLDIAKVFFGVLININPVYFLALVACWAYAYAYSVMLWLAAKHDTRNVGRFRTQHFARVILCEQLSRGDLRAVIFVISVPLVPIIFFVAIFATFRH